MTFTWPQPLHPLRDLLKQNGVEHDRHATARQAAFFAQQVVGSKIKFPPQGSDMTSTLMLIQKAMPEHKPVTYRSVGIDADLFGTAPGEKGKKAGGGGKQKPPQPGYLTAFSPTAVSAGHHVFADGASIPNPGAGGWGIAAYCDGAEIYSECGGEADSTNNRMELTSALKAIQWAKQYPNCAIVIWTDSQYVCNGINEWRHGWNAKGWRRGSDKALEKNQSLANVDLWKAIDEALAGPRAASVSVCWVKGHNGTVGNERADELAEMGRQNAVDLTHSRLSDDLDAEYRNIMAG